MVVNEASERPFPSVATMARTCHKSKGKKRKEIDNNNNHLHLVTVKQKGKLITAV